MIYYIIAALTFLTGLVLRMRGKAERDRIASQKVIDDVLAYYATPIEYRD